MEAQAKDIDIDHIIDKLLEVRGYSIFHVLIIFNVDVAQESKLTSLNKKSEASVLSPEIFSSTNLFSLS